MLLLRHPPSAESGYLPGYYRQVADEGLVHTSWMRNERYEVCGRFDPAWSVPAICWCAGGSESYALTDEKVTTLKAGGALLLGEGARYAYAAQSDRPFRSYMIAFPRRLRDRQPRSGGAANPQTFDTTLFLPSAQSSSRMTAITRACESRSQDAAWFDEHVASLYADLVGEYDNQRRRVHRLDVAKNATRQELARRTYRAIAVMHERYGDPELTVAEVSRTACMARGHFIRAFKAVRGQAPSHYLSRVRMEAAASLLRETGRTVGAVAADVGFRDRPAFHRRFRAHFGLSPVQYRAAPATPPSTHES